VSSGIPVVYSTEVPGDVKLLPLPEEEFEKGDVKELGVLDDFRVRIVPVLGTLQALPQKCHFFVTYPILRHTSVNLWSSRCDMDTLRSSRQTNNESISDQKSQKNV
jgi:hypothetical protein